MNRPILNVVSNADQTFFPGLAVALASTLAAASGKFDYHFHILDGGILPDSLHPLHSTLTSIATTKNIQVTLDLLPLDETRLLPLPPRRGSRMTYAKLVLPEILPQLNSIIYLDADVLCFAGIESVHAPAHQPQWLLAGATDYFNTIEKDCPWLDQVPPKDRKLPYINAGIMWMNLKGLREMDFTTLAIAARAAIGEARQGDQSVFNFLCRGRSYILPPYINHRTTIGANTPLCQGDLHRNIHYIGSPKPWLGHPKTSNWLAHQLWHQAQTTLFPHLPTQTCPPPPDLKTIRCKAALYTLFNHRRAAHYRSDLNSLTDPKYLLENVSQQWHF